MSPSWKSSVSAFFSIYLCGCGGGEWKKAVVPFAIVWNLFDFSFTKIKYAKNFYCQHRECYFIVWNIFARFSTKSIKCTNKRTYTERGHNLSLSLPPPFPLSLSLAQHSIHAPSPHRRLYEKYRWHFFVLFFFMLNKREIGKFHGCKRMKGRNGNYSLNQSVFSAGLQILSKKKLKEDVKSDSHIERKREGGRESKQNRKGKENKKKWIWNVVCNCRIEICRKWNACVFFS